MSYSPSARLMDKVMGSSSKKAGVDTTNELAVVQRFRLVGPIFEDTTLDTNFWSKTETNGGTVTVATNIATLATSTATDGIAKLRSGKKARYVAGVGNVWRGHIKLGDTGTAGCVRKWGVFDDSSYGCYFQLDGTTFSVVANKSGAETKVDSGNFVGDNGAGYSLDTGWHVYEIIYGASVISFFIDDVLMHRMATNASGLVDALTLPANAWISKTSGALDRTLAIRTMSIFRLGFRDVSPITIRVAGAVTTQILKRGAGCLRRVIVGSKGTLCTIYDSIGDTSGTIAVIDTSVTSASFEFGTEFETGLTVTTTGSNSDLTFIFD